MNIFDSIAEQESARVDGTMKRAAKLRQDLTDHERATVRLFERIKKQTDEAAEARMMVDFPLSPELQAAYQVWEQGADMSPDRKVIVHFPSATEWSATQRKPPVDIGEAPIGPELP